MTFQPFRARFLGAWGWLSQTPASAPANVRRQARLIAGIGLSLLVLLLLVSGLLLFLATSLRAPEAVEACVFLGSALLALAALYINRHGHSQIGAGLVLSVASIDTWGAVLINHGTMSGGQSLFYPLVTIVLCGLLLPTWATVITTAGNLLMLLVVSGLTGPTETNQILGPGIFYVAVAVISGLAGILRDDDLTRLESRERALAESESKYRRIVDLAQEGIWITDSANHTTFVNRRMAAMLGASEAQIIGSDAFAYIDKTDLPDADAALERRRSGQTDQHDVLLRRQDGSALWAITTATPLTDEAGQYAGVLALVTDITERKQSEAALNESQQRFESAFQNAAVGMALVATDGRWLQVNPAVCDMLGYSREELLAANSQRLTHPADLEHERDSTQKLLAGPQTSLHLEKRYIHKNGQLVWTAVSMALVRDAQDQPLYFVSLIQDISERKQALESLRDSGERYRRMFEEAERLREFNASIIRNMAEGLVVADEKGTITLVNPKMAAILGYSENEAIGTDQLQLIAPQALEKTRRMADERPKGVTSAYESLLLAKNGAAVPVLISATPLMQGSLFRGTLSTITDITERKRAEAELQQANDKLTLWLTEAEQRTHDMSLLNELGELLLASQTAEEAHRLIEQLMPALFPGSAGRLFVLRASRNLLDAVGQWGAVAGAPDSFEPNECWGLRRGHSHVVQSINPDSDAGQPPAVICSHVKEPRPAAYICVPMLGLNESLGVLHLQRPAGAVDAQPAWSAANIQLARTVADTAAMALASLRLRETLRLQSIRDALTGLFNRRYLEETLERELSRARREQQPLGVMMLDIDHFKQFNDTLGHEAGDQVLRAVSSVLKAHARAEDIACRYGGEEFLLLLPGASLTVTLARAEAICQAVRAIGTDLRGGAAGSVTMSIGVAAFPEHGDKGSDLIQLADATLYQAKRAGRDQVLAAVSAV